MLYNLNTLLDKKQITNKIEKVYEVEDCYYIKLFSDDKYDDSLWKIDKNNSSDLNAELCSFVDCIVGNDKIKELNIETFLNNNKELFNKFIKK